MGSLLISKCYFSSNLSGVLPLFLSQTLTKKKLDIKLSLSKLKKLNVAVLLFFCCFVLTLSKVLRVFRGESLKKFQKNLTKILCCLFQLNVILTKSKVSLLVNVSVRQANWYKHGIIFTVLESTWLLLETVDPSIRLWNFLKRSLDIPNFALRWGRGYYLK